MTTISAKIITDSISPDKIRLTTMELRYPRCIHSEFMTHRQFSRNAASSRAIPVKKMIQSILADPFVPLHWGKNEKGMQASTECNEMLELMEEEFYTPDGDDYDIQSFFENASREEGWQWGLNQAITLAEAYDKAGYHKQIINRLLEPWMHITVVVSSTEWANFYSLRDHPDAEPHIALLAKEMRKAHGDSVPKSLDFGEWHTPYVDREDFAGEKWNEMAAFSAARCARTSYLLHDGTRPTSQHDLELYERLAYSRPMHASPLEHQATPDRFVQNMWLTKHQHGNFTGWRQFRKMHPGECAY